MAEFKSVNAAFKGVQKIVKKSVDKKKSQIAGAINKELTATRKEIVESMMTKTGLKRKALNDRLSITRANPKSETLEGRITPLYGKRIYMSEYPFKKAKGANGRAAITLTSPIYKKAMKTGFMSADGKRMYLRLDDTQKVRAVKGRSIPRLFDEFKLKDLYENSIIERVIRAIKSIA